MKIRLKRMIISLLIVSMILTNAGFATLASSPLDGEVTDNENDLTHKYYDELKNKESDDATTSTDSDVDKDTEVATDSESESDDDDSVDSAIASTNSEFGFTNSDSDNNITSGDEKEKNNIATDSEIKEDNSFNATATDSDIEENDISIATESDIDIEVVDPTEPVNKDQTTLPSEDTFSTFNNNQVDGSVPGINGGLWSETKRKITANKKLVVGANSSSGTKTNAMTLMSGTYKVELETTNDRRYANGFDGYVYIMGRKCFYIYNTIPINETSDTYNLGFKYAYFKGRIQYGWSDGGEDDAKIGCDYEWTYDGKQHYNQTNNGDYICSAYKDDGGALTYVGYPTEGWYDEFNHFKDFGKKNDTWVTPPASGAYSQISSSYQGKVNEAKYKGTSTSLQLEEGQSFSALPVKELDLQAFTWEKPEDLSGQFANMTNLESITFSSDTNINETKNATSMFEGDTNLTTITMNKTGGFNSITNATKMFKDCSNLKSISLTGNMVMENATTTESMFEGCTSLEMVDLGTIPLDKIRNAKNMFKGCSSLKTIKIGTNVMSPSSFFDGTDMFDGCSNLVGGGGFHWAAGNTGREFAKVDCGGLFPGYFTYNGTGKLDVTLPVMTLPSTSPKQKNDITKIVFSSASNIGTYDTSLLLFTDNNGYDYYGHLDGDTLKIHWHGDSINLMLNSNYEDGFKDYANLTEIDGFDKLDLSSLVNASGLFENNSKLTKIELPDTFGVKLANTSRMFKGCSGFTSLTLPNSFNTATVSDMSEMFDDCDKLKSIKADNLVINSATTTENMFRNCKALTSLNLGESTFDDLANSKNMFDGCENLAVVNIATNLRHVKNSATTTDMFKGCIKLIGGGGFKFDSNHTDGEYARVDYGGILPGYFTCTDNNIYKNVHLDIDKIWADNITKANITKIVFSTSSTIEVYSGEFSLPMMNLTANSKGYLKDGGQTILIHIAPQIRRLVGATDWSGVFKDFTNLKSIEELEDIIDTTAVTNMDELFSGCKSLEKVEFNPNTPNVTNMSKVFYNCASLSQVHIGSQLKLDKVKNLESAFENCKSLSVLDIGISNFSSIENLKNTFKNCESLTAFNFDVCPVTHLQTTEGMFDGCKNLTRIYCNDNFQGLQHISYDNMFNGCVKLIGGEGFTYSPTEPKSKSGEFARVDYGGIMPGYYTISNKDKYKNVAFDLETDWYRSTMLPKDQVLKIKFFNTSQAAGGIGSYDEMFYMSDADKTRAYVEVGTKTVKIHYGHDIDTLKFRGDVEGMFQNFVNLTEIEGMENLDASRIENMSGMFANCKKIKTATIPNGLINAATLSELFKNCESLESVQFGSGVQIENVENLDGMFENCPALKTVDFGTAFDMSNVTSMDRMFKDCSSLTSIKFNQNINTGMIESTREMFAGCSSLTNESLAAMASLDVRNVKDMGYMFASCSSIKKADFTNIEVNELTNMEGMFSGCKDLTDVSFGAKFDTSKVTNMSHLFEGCENLKGTPLNQNINTNPKKTSFLAKLFGDGNNNDPTNYNVLDLSDLNTENVTDMSGMFLNCSGINVIDISNINTESVEDMSEMFANCHELTYIVSKDFATASVITSTDMFKNCPKLVGGEGTEWAKTRILDNVYAVVDMGPNSAKPGYFIWGDVYITYNGGEGTTGSMEKESVGRFKAHSLAPNQFMKTGYSFNGWKDENGNSYPDGWQVRLNRSLVLTATWNKNSGSSPSGGGPSGGGTGGNKANNVPANNNKTTTQFYDSGNSKYVTEIDFVFHTMLEDKDFEWEYNEKGERNSIKVKKSSDIAKAFLSQGEYSSHYIDNPNSDYINLKKGYFNVEHNGGGFYFGFDDAGKLIAGFIVTTSKTGDYQIDQAENKIIELGKKDSAKYYLYNGTDELKNVGPYKGIVWNLPAVISKIEYIFDPEGRVVSEKVIKDSKGESIFNKGMWEYDPSSNEWRFFITNEGGKRMYVNDCIAAIKDRAGNDHYYIFGLDGVMQKGLVRYMDKTYYLIESGPNEGSMYIGNITLDGKDYVFSEDGLLSVSVSSMSKSE